MQYQLTVPGTDSLTECVPARSFGNLLAKNTCSIHRLENRDHSATYWLQYASDQCSLIYNGLEYKANKIIVSYEALGLTSAHFFGRTKRPIRPASLALNIFSNKGVITEFELSYG